MSKTPAEGEKVEPIVAFADKATVGLSRKQRAFATAYLGLLDTGDPRSLRTRVPANLYRGYRHFLADSEWDHHELVWRAAARVLRQLTVEWLACGVSAVAGKWNVAYLAAYDRREIVPVDIELAGPARLIRSPEEYVASQYRLLQTAPDSLLRRAPLAIAGALAESATIRAELASRGVTYSAGVRVGSPALGPVHLGAQRRSLSRVIGTLHDTGAERAGTRGVSWATEEIVLQPPEVGEREERLVCYWQEEELVATVLTNARDEALTGRIYDIAKPDALILPRPHVPWRATGLRGARAWEHHLALVAAHHAYDVERRKRGSPTTPG